MSHSEQRPTRLGPKTVFAMDLRSWAIATVFVAATILWAYDVTKLTNAHTRQLVNIGKEVDYLVIMEKRRQEKTAVVTTVTPPSLFSETELQDSGTDSEIALPSLWPF